jgi:hypothetical protein
MELPDIGRYRRRFIVEFGPEDSGLIDRMGVAHRTKRAAIIAGLRLLESGELDRLRSQVAELEADLAAVRAAATATKATSVTTAKADKAKADLTAEREAHGRTRRALKKAETALTDKQTALAQAHLEIAGLQAERDRLVDRLPYAAYCRECEHLVPETEWGEHAVPSGIDVYHTAHPYRERRGVIGRSTTPLLQRHTPGQGTR